MTVDMIMGRDLTTEETQKLKQVDNVVTQHFAATDKVVRLCEGSSHGDERTIGICHGLVGPPMVLIKSAQFLSASEGELRHHLQWQK